MELNVKSATLIDNAIEMTLLAFYILILIR